MFKKLFLLFLSAMIVLSACGTFDVGIEQTPMPTPNSAEVATIVAATLAAFPSATPTSSIEPPTVQVPTDSVSPTGQASTGIHSAYSGTSFVLPDGLGSGAAAQTIPAVPDADHGGGWLIAPDYIDFTIDGYPVHNEYFSAEIRVYPAQDYAAVSSGAAESISRIRMLTANTDMVINSRTAPGVPFINAGPTFQAHATLIKFQNGAGVRTLTQYDQAPLPINNIETFYHFEGLTSDEKYYVVATLPINSPILAADDTPDASIPAGGIPFDFNLDQGNLLAYYKSVTENVENAGSDTFKPNLTTLDALIGSIKVEAP